MADRPTEAGGNGQVPPAAEQVHMPGPSYVPVAVAFGTTLAVIGIVISWALFAIGAVILVVGVLRWVRQTREDIAELPLGH
jgi:chromate transport protein ChrA